MNDTPELTHASLSRLNDALGLYAAYAKGSVDEILAKKGNDLRIQLYTGFRDAKWKGDNIADIEMRRRAAQGRGTLIRKATYENPGAPPPGLNKRQAIVWREVQRRQAGVGILAVSWLLRRWRYRKTGKYLTANKAGPNAIGSVTSTTESAELGILAKVEQRPGSLRLTGMTPGMAEVANRYAIVSSALDRVTNDMMPYIRRKLDAEARLLFPKAI